MNSLRSRLTISYAVVVAVVLAAVALLGCRILFEIVARPALERLSLSAARAEAAATAPLPRGTRETAAQAVVRTIAAAKEPGVLVFAPGFNGPRGPRFFSPPASMQAPPENAGLPDGAEPPGGARPPGGTPDADGPRDGRLRPPGADGGRSALDSPFIRGVVGPTLGLSARVVPVRGYRVIIAPDLTALDPVLREFTWFVGVSLVLSIVLAWAFASWLAHQAVMPIVSLTRELQRFSAGDFMPRSVTTTERSELGSLVAAYNGAAAQVTSAFNERLLVEQQMRRFIADAGHELRTPLTVIGGYLEILRKGGIDDPLTCERALETLTGEARRMRTLIDRLLALARLERPDVSELKCVRIRDVAADAIAHVRAARGGDISLECPDAVVVFADRAELSEAIENVVDNAVKYGARSAVAVRVESVSAQAIIRVTDGGGGIPESQRGRLFERFFRGDDRGEIEGTGLGLAIAERAIARCGGQVSLEDSRPGRTTFSLTIPTVAAQMYETESLRL